MIQRSGVQSIAKGYDPALIHIGIFGSHSTRETGAAARAAGFRTYLIAEVVT